MTGPRALTTDEHALLDALLAADFPGVEPLRQQARDVLASPGCSCGCGTIHLHPQGEPPLSDAQSPLPSEGHVRDDTGEVVGGLICFVKAGLLSDLEVYAYYGEPAAAAACRARGVGRLTAHQAAFCATRKCRSCSRHPVRVRVDMPVILTWRMRIASAAAPRGPALSQRRSA